MDEDDHAATIPLPNINSDILDKVLDWCQFHKDDPPPPEDEENVEKRTDNLCEFDIEFLKVDQGTLFELILAAKYLDIKGLLDAACKKVANMIKGKTPEEIRKVFNIKKDRTPAEEGKAAKYLELFDASCKTVPNMIKGKTPEEIRKLFNIKNDFTPAEEEQAAKKTASAKSLVKITSDRFT